MDERATDSNSSKSKHGCKLRRPPKVTLCIRRCTRPANGLWTSKIWLRPYDANRARGSVAGSIARHTLMHFQRLHSHRAYGRTAACGSPASHQNGCTYQPRPPSHPECLEHVVTRISSLRHRLLNQADKSPGPDRNLIRQQSVRHARVPLVAHAGNRPSSP